MTRKKQETEFCIQKSVSCCIMNKSFFRIQHYAEYAGKELHHGYLPYL